MRCTMALVASITLTPVGGSATNPNERFSNDDWTAPRSEPRPRQAGGPSRDQPPPEHRYK